MKIDDIDQRAENIAVALVINADYDPYAATERAFKILESPLRDEMAKREIAEKVKRRAAG